MDKRFRRRLRVVVTKPVETKSSQNQQVSLHQGDEPRIRLDLGTAHDEVLQFEHWLDLVQHFQQKFLRLMLQFVFQSQERPVDVARRLAFPSLLREPSNQATHPVRGIDSIDETQVSRSCRDAWCSTPSLVQAPFQAFVASKLLSRRSSLGTAEGLVQLRSATQSTKLVRVHAASTCQSPNLLTELLVKLLALPATASVASQVAKTANLAEGLPPLLAILQPKVVPLRVPTSPGIDMVSLQPLRKDPLAVGRSVPPRVELQKDLALVSLGQLLQELLCPGEHNLATYFLLLHLGKLELVTVLLVSTLRQVMPDATKKEFPLVHGGFAETLPESRPAKVILKVRRTTSTIAVRRCSKVSPKVPARLHGKVVPLGQTNRDAGRTVGHATKEWQLRMEHQKLRHQPRLLVPKDLQSLRVFGRVVQEFFGTPGQHAMTFQVATSRAFVTASENATCREGAVERTFPGDDATASKPLKGTAVYRVDVVRSGGTARQLGHALRVQGLQLSRKRRVGHLLSQGVRGVLYLSTAGDLHGAQLPLTTVGRHDRVPRLLSHVSCQDSLHLGRVRRGSVVQSKQTARPVVRLNQDVQRRKRRVVKLLLPSHQPPLQRIPQRAMVKRQSRVTLSEGQQRAPDVGRDAQDLGFLLLTEGLPTWSTPEEAGRQVRGPRTKGVPLAQNLVPQSVQEFFFGRATGVQTQGTTGPWGPSPATVRGSGASLRYGARESVAPADLVDLVGVLHVVQWHLGVQPLVQGRNLVATLLQPAELHTWSTCGDLGKASVPAQPLRPAGPAVQGVHAAVDVLLPHAQQVPTRRQADLPQCPQEARLPRYDLVGRSLGLGVRSEVRRLASPARSSGVQRATAGGLVALPEVGQGARQTVALTGQGGLQVALARGDGLRLGLLADTISFSASPSSLQSRVMRRDVLVVLQCGLQTGFDRTSGPTLQQVTLQRQFVAHQHPGKGGACRPSRATFSLGPTRRVEEGPSGP